MVPYARAPYREGGDNITRLLMEQGRLRADSAQRSGDIWGQTVQSLGQQAGGAIEAHQMAKRDAALDAALKTWDGKDPRALFDSLKMLDPMSRAKVTEGMVGIMRLGQKDEAQERENWALAVKGAAALPFPVFAANWATIKERLGPGAQKYVGVGELPEQADEQTYNMARQLAQQFGGAKAPEGFTLSEGQTRFGPDGQPVANVPSAPPKPAGPRVVGRSLVDDSGKVIYRDPESPSQPPVDPLHQVDVNGVATWLPRSQAAGKPAAQAQRTVTGAERTALGFYNRAKQASEDITPIEEKIAGAGMASQIQLQNAPNFLQTETQQQYRQAQRAFTEARLRKESGAAIPDHEYANDAKTYFAQPGDGPELMAQKRAARQVVLQGLQYGAGKAYEEYYGEAPPTPRNQMRVNGPVDINAPPTVGPKRIKNDADYDSLPSGAEFIGPDGKRRRKP
jgi:hypothetical protein